MKNIVRVEHKKDGKGMWRSAHSICGLEEFTDLTDRHSTCNPNGMRTPWQEGIYLELNQVCAYKSRNHIKKWINKEEMTKLKNAGFNIYLIKIYEKDIIMGKDQVIFNKKDIVHKIDITEKLINSH